RLLWHPALSVESGAEARAILEDVANGKQALDILCVEGAIARGPGGFRRVADGVSFAEAVALFRARLATPGEADNRRTVIARAYQAALKRLPSPEEYDRWNALMVANRAWYAKVVIDLGGKLPKPATPID
ncbi:MAG: hypothetical protein K2P79_06470, partial [Sphingomonas sp.]|nr:hypothetical protein [Sphingomonas sp.]